MADALDLGSSTERRTGSSPVPRTKLVAPSLFYEGVSLVNTPFAATIESVRAGRARPRFRLDRRYSFNQAQPVRSAKPLFIRRITG